MVLDQECISEEEARGRAAPGREREEEFPVQGLAEASADLHKLLTELDGPDAERFSSAERTVHGALSASKLIYDRKKKPSEPP